jgi:PST family polysaccharide transporter
MARTVGWGFVWMILNTGAAKLASFGAQVALGALLSAHDFGVFAISTSIAALTSVLRDGGVRQILTQRGDEYESLAGPLFWMGLVLNLIVGALLVAATPFLVALYHEPQLALLLLVTAISVPLATPSAVLSARLAVGLRFRAISLMQTGSALLRYGGAVFFARAGLGPVSFVLPLPLVALFEWSVTYSLTRSPLWSRRAEPRRWRKLFSDARWVLLGTFAVGLCNTGTYFLLGILLPASVVGVYFFAYQLVIQVGILLAANLNQVLFPALARLQGEPERQRLAVLRSLRMLMLVAAPMSLGLVAVFAPLERLVWHGRWADSIVPVQIISVCYPLNVALGVPMSLQLANGWFRQWGVMLLLYGGGLVLAGAAGALVSGSATGVAIWTGAYIVLGSVLHTTLSLRRVGLRGPAVLGAMTPACALSCAAAGAALLIDRWGLSGSSLLVRITVGSVAFSVLLLAGVRWAIPSQVREVLEMAPQAARRPLLMLLRI